MLKHKNSTMKIKSITLMLLMVAVSFQVFSQEKSLKRKVAIGRFSNETQYSKSVFYDKTNDPMGKQASDILSTRLASTDKFLLIERQDYDKIVNELNTGGGVSQKIGADFLIIGSITEYGRKNIGEQKLFSSSKKQVVEAGVSIRLVDVSTGLVIYSGEAKGEAETTDKQVMGFGKSADFDATLSDKAISAAITKLVENIITKCTNNPWKAYILSVEDGSYIVSGGEAQGIAAGDEFVVMEKGKKVKNPQTGLLIELPGKAIGKLKVIQTTGNLPEEQISIATLTEGSVDAAKLDSYYVTQKK